MHSNTQVRLIAVAAHRFCSGVRNTPYGMVLLPAALFVAMSILPIPTVAAQPLCANYSLSRNEIARAQAVARPTLPVASHLAVNFVCWNPDSARVGLETPKVVTTEGVQQWWKVLCQRSESAWTCDPPELNHFVAADLPVQDRSHTVELSFGRDIDVVRARALASRALSIYSDPTARLRDCGTIEESGSEPVGSHRHDSRASANEPYHVSVRRDGSRDSVTLDDVDVVIYFDARAATPDEQSPCWLDVVVVN